MREKRRGRSSGSGTSSTAILTITSRKVACQGFAKCRRRIRRDSTASCFFIPLRRRFGGMAAQGDVLASPAPKAQGLGGIRIYAGKTESRRTVPIDPDFLKGTRQKRHRRPGMASSARAEGSPQPGSPSCRQKGSCHEVDAKQGDDDPGSFAKPDTSMPHGAVLQPALHERGGAPGDHFGHQS
ncbi:hypothetical protein DesfrDRAFT_0877 [Solidesulfovibrio fructosivorans JJ]]|uniref:Uncharacterized protein n=1 Tax=Solidesulfovibrio fructosivorans JJ] TaxID=596151 RepID=E1JTC8_SOLFR|nr:hypothetical protein DesfrDRAFT_0877 [Solidesulfovibrio fructosivorans JJ]]